MQNSKKNYCFLQNFWESAILVLYHFYMKKRTILIPIILFAVLGIGIFAFWKIFLAQSKSPQIDDFLQNNLEMLGETGAVNNDTESFNRAMYYANEKACQDIKNEAEKTNCTDYAAIAKAGKTGSKEFCESVKNESRKNECYAITLEKIAMEKMNKWVCQTISIGSIRTRCQEGIDAKNLQKIIREWNATSDSCAGLSDTFRRECSESIKNYKTEENYIQALQSRNISLCEQIGEVTLRQKCRDEIFAYQAEITNNPELCKQIINPDARNSCDQKWRNKNNEQLYGLAIKTEEIAMCKNITNEKMQQSCSDIVLLSTIRKTKNYWLCDSLYSTESKNTCQKIKNS